MKSKQSKAKQRQRRSCEILRAHLNQPTDSSSSSSSSSLSLHSHLFSSWREFSRSFWNLCNWDLTDDVEERIENPSASYTRFRWGREVLVRGMRHWADLITQLRLVWSICSSQCGHFWFCYQRSIFYAHCIIFVGFYGYGLYAKSTLWHFSF